MANPVNEKISLRQSEDQAKLIAALRKSPIVQIACQQANVSRATYYRWRKENTGFAKSCDEAINEGDELVNDMAESKLITAIKEQNFNAISFWLRKRSPRFRDRLEVTALNLPKDELTPEQEAVVREALRLASLSVTVQSETTPEKPLQENIIETNNQPQ